MSFSRSRIMNTWSQRCKTRLHQGKVIPWDMFWTVQHRPCGIGYTPQARLWGTNNVTHFPSKVIVKIFHHWPGHWYGREPTASCLGNTWTVTFAFGDTLCGMQLEYILVPRRYWLGNGRRVGKALIREIVLAGVSLEWEDQLRICYQFQAYTYVVKLYPWYACWHISLSVSSSGSPKMGTNYLSHRQTP